MKNYIKYIRRQSKHIQHIHAAIFSGALTTLIAVVVLYADYGFWQEKYVRNDTLTTDELTLTAKKEEPKIDSPVETLGKFFEEAKVRISGVQLSSVQLLEGKEVYIKDEGEASTTNQN